MSSLKNQIIKALEKVAEIESPQVEFTSNDKFGDYSTNIALQNKELNAAWVAAKINDLNLNFTAEVAGKFINFWLKKDVLVNILIQINQEKENFGKSDLEKNKLAIVEYSSPNIAKPFTVGHLRSTIIGDAVANLMEAVGYKVLRDNHLGDWGTQFGKEIYAIKTWGSEEDIEKSDNPVKELVTLYVKFHEEAQKDPSLDDSARVWFKRLEEGDIEARRIWKKCIDWSFVEFDKIYSKLGIKFSNEFQKGRGLGESFFEGRMQVVVDELNKKGLLKEGKEGAQLVFFKNDKYPPAMILKKDGTSLYHTRDLATDKYRLEKYNPDLIINEVGVEQKLYFEQLFEIENILGWYKPGQRVHIAHSLIRFKDKKMSTRKGNVIWMEEVLTEAEKRAKKLGSETEKLAQVVAIGALKYNDLKREPKTEIVFDWDEVINMEGNSGPYLQYTYARTQSVLQKVKGGGSLENKSDNLDTEELGILRILARYNEVVVSSANNFSPNTLCNYLYLLAQKYNTFYNKDKIIGSGSEEFRLTLTQATACVLKNGLKLLGIESPERM